MNFNSNEEGRSHLAEYDAIIIGAGFAGLYMLKKLRGELGLKVQVIERAGGIGGTWHWNRYPGAVSDSDTYLYCYSFDADLLEDWNWNTRYVRQPQILEYLVHVADRFDLRRSISLNTEVVAAKYDESNNRWEIRTDSGTTLTSKYLVTALGLLSRINVPVGADRKLSQVFNLLC